MNLVQGSGLERSSTPDQRRTLPTQTPSNRHFPGRVLQDANELWSQQGSTEHA
jgi:hypothetical protein